MVKYLSRSILLYTYYTLAVCVKKMMDHLSNSLPQRLVTAFGKCKARIHLRNISSEITSNKQTNKRPQERREECHRGRLGRSGAVCRRLPPRPGSRTWRGNIWRCEFTPTCCLELCCVAWAILSCVCDSQWYCCSDPEWLLWYFGIWKRQNMAVESTVWIYSGPMGHT